MRFLHVVIFEAERCWAYAMQLKDLANTEPRRQHHKMKRLKKAVKHAETLALLCSSTKCDAMTKLEAQVRTRYSFKSSIFQFLILFYVVGVLFVDERNATFRAGSVARSDGTIYKCKVG